MLLDAIKGYVQLVSGLSDATSEKAKEVAQGMLSAAGIASPNEVASQVSGMAEEVLSTARAQRESLVGLVRAEVTTVVDSSGLARNADLDAIKTRLTQLAADVERVLDQMPGAQARHDAARFVEEHSPAALTAASMRARGRSSKKSSSDGDGSGPTAGGLPEAPRPASVKRTAATKKAATKKAATKSAPAKSAATKKTATKAATEQAAPAKTASTKAAGTKNAATAKRAATARKAPATSGSARKGTATKRATPAKKSTARTATSPADG